LILVVGLYDILYVKLRQSSIVMPTYIDRIALLFLLENTLDPNALYIFTLKG